jgi:hypothetical protein
MVRKTYCSITNSLQVPPTLMRCSTDCLRSPVRP